MTFIQVLDNFTRVIARIISGEQSGPWLACSVCCGYQNSLVPKVLAIIWVEFRKESQHCDVWAECNDNGDIVTVFKEIRLMALFYFHLCLYFPNRDILSTVNSMLGNKNERNDLILFNCLSGPSIYISIRLNSPSKTSLRFLFLLQIVSS